MKEVCDVMPYLSHLEALNMAAQALACQSFSSNQARTDAIFDLAARLFVRYHQERDELFAQFPATTNEDDVDAAVRSAERLKMLVGFLRDIQPKA